MVFMVLLAATAVHGSMPAGLACFAMKKPPNLAAGGLCYRGYPLARTPHSPGRDFSITEMIIMEMEEAMFFMARFISF
jgi:hypothetical protein